MTDENHYLKIDCKAPHHWTWECSCGAHGQGPTELACEFSHERHMFAVEFQRGRGRL